MQHVRRHMHTRESTVPSRTFLASGFRRSEFLTSLKAFTFFPMKVLLLLNFSLANRHRCFVRESNRRDVSMAARRCGERAFFEMRRVRPFRTRGARGGERQPRASASVARGAGARWRGGGGAGAGGLGAGGPGLNYRLHRAREIAACLHRM